MCVASCRGLRDSTNKAGIGAGAVAKAEAGVGTLHTNHKYVLYKFVLVNMNRIALAARQQAPRQRVATGGQRGQGAAR